MRKCEKTRHNFPPLLFKAFVLFHCSLLNPKHYSFRIKEKRNLSLSLQKGKDD